MDTSCGCSGWLNNAIKDVAEKYADKYREIIKDSLLGQQKSKEEPTMKVTYNGIAGELIKLERKEQFAVDMHDQNDIKRSYYYNLTIYDREKKATISFENVKLSDVRFSGAEVSFNG